MKASFVCWRIQVDHDTTASVSVTAASAGAVTDASATVTGASATDSAAVSSTKSKYSHPLALEWLGNLWLLRARLPNRVGCRTEC